MGKQLTLISKQGYECTVLNQKTSMSILPDTDPVVQAIKRMHYPASNWYQRDLQTIHEVPFEGNGWIWCEDALVKPVMVYWSTATNIST